MEKFSKPRSLLPPPTHTILFPQGSIAPSPDATVRKRIPRVSRRPSNDPGPLAPFSARAAARPPPGRPHGPHRACVPLPRPAPHLPASRSGRPGPVPSPHPRLPDPAAPRARSRPGPDCPLCSSLTGPRFGLSGPSGRSRLLVRRRIRGCGPGRGIGPGWRSSAFRAASSQGCHLRTPPSAHGARTAARPGRK